MIDRPARRQLAQALRHLVAGVIGRNEFENRIPGKSKDIAVNEIFQAAWCLYSDFGSDCWLTGKNKLDPKARKIVLKWILFLYTDLEYAWPRNLEVEIFIIFVLSVIVLFSVTIALHSLIALLITLVYLPVGLLICLLVRHIMLVKYRSHGDFQHWPFIKKDDFLEALTKPVFLTGKISHKKES